MSVAFCFDVQVYLPEILKKVIDVNQSRWLLASDLHPISWKRRREKRDCSMMENLLFHNGLEEMLIACHSCIELVVYRLEALCLLEELAGERAWEERDWSIGG